MTEKVMLYLIMPLKNPGRQHFLEKEKGGMYLPCSSNIMRSTSKIEVSTFKINYFSNLYGKENRVIHNNKQSQAAI